MVMLLKFMPLRQSQINLAQSFEQFVMQVLPPP
jgi:hypothetical protein